MVMRRVMMMIAKAESKASPHYFLFIVDIWFRPQLNVKWNLLESPASESSDPKLVDWVGDTVPGLKKISIN